MAIISVDGIIAGAKPPISIYKPSLAAKAAATFASLWVGAGSPVAGAKQGSLAGAIPTKDTTGAIQFTNPTAPNLLYLISMVLMSTAIGGFSLYDRLWHNSLINTTIATEQVFNGSALTRYTDGVGVDIWLECYTNSGSTGVTLTVKYYNTLNVLKTTTVSVPASMVANQMIRVPLLAGDFLKSVYSCQLSATTGTAGDWGITVLKKIADIPVMLANSGPPHQDFAALGMPEIETDACLAFMVLASGTATGTIYGNLSMSEG